MIEPRVALISPFWSFWERSAGLDLREETEVPESVERRDEGVPIELGGKCHS